LAGGYQTLIDELVGRSHARWVQAAVQRLEPAGSGWALRDDTGQRWEADAVVLAIPAPRLARLLEGSNGLSRRACAAASRITSASSVVVALAVPADTPLPECSGVLVATGEPLRAKAITLSSRKWGSAGMKGEAQFLRLSFGRFGDDLATSSSDEELLAWARQDLAAVFGLEVEPVDARLQRWIEAMPQYGPGHAELVAEVRAGLPSGLAVAGSYLDGIGVPACIGAAGRAVEALEV
jgi:oxygen-dependent protoporphyrinogen oxidase